MLIGFTANWDDDSASSEQALLHELGCERIFSGSEGFITEDVLDFVRPGDTLVLSDITALGKSLQDVVLMAERLYKGGISIHAIRSGLIPGSAVGDNFANVCSILAEMLRASGDKVTNLKKSSGRGRPAALAPEEQALRCTIAPARQCSGSGPPFESLSGNDLPIFSASSPSIENRRRKLAGATRDGT